MLSPAADAPARRRAVAALLLAAGLLALPARVAAEACLDCHEKKSIGAGARSVHPPFAEDDCTACHQDHGDEERLMLVETGNALCTGCHDTDDKGFLKAHHDVRGDKVACVSCHDPHRSTEEHLLVPNRHRPLAFGRCDPCHRYDGKLHKPVPALCLSCHEGEEFARRIAHAPVRRGECLSCHDPHASRETALLKARYAPGRWSNGERDVALCLRCHDRRNYFTDAVDATLFRSAGRNYHALHLRVSPTDRAGGGRQALSCRSCHETHGSDGPRLVRRELDCDGVPCLRLDYSRSDFGGQCLSGCHAPQSYRFAGEARPVGDYVSRGDAPAPPSAPAPAPGSASASAPASARPRAAVPEPSALEQSINRKCVSCHEKAVKRFAKGRIHAPVRAGTCSACHLDHGPENRLILLGPEDRVCGRCHDLRAAAMTGAHAGYALAGSRCSECHDPHGGEAAGYVLPRRHPPFDEKDCGACHGAPAAGWKITGGGVEVCRQCHDEVGREAHPHTAIAAKGCLGCHKAHAAAEPALLRAPRPALCFRCHPRERFVQETVHEPVRDGDCAGCHPAHGSAAEGLLARSYPIAQYAAFAGDNFKLCWECHDEGALTDPARGADTGFVDGERNLHALHLRDRVSKSELGTRVQPGVTCRNCHDPHATEFPRLIRSSLDCGGVPCLKIEFHKVGAGGKCLGGCHITQSYLPAAGR
jgi:predicted CXXCH cytochrome family protein